LPREFKFPRDSHKSYTLPYKFSNSGGGEVIKPDKAKPVEAKPEGKTEGK